MTDLDLDALAAVAEAALRKGDWYDLGDLWEALNGIADVGDDTEADARHIWEARPATVLALIAEVREARAEAIRENAQMLTVQDELNEALDSICEHKAAMTDMRRRKEAAEADLERLRREVAALAKRYVQRRDSLRRRATGKRPADGMDRREANTWDVAAEELRALIGGER